MGYQLFVGPEKIKHEANTVSSVKVKPVSYEFIDINGLEFQNGRFYNESEANSGAQVIVIGDEIARVTARKDKYGEVKEFICNDCRFNKKSFLIGKLKVHVKLTDIRLFPLTIMKKRHQFTHLY